MGSFFLDGLLSWVLPQRGRLVKQNVLPSNLSIDPKFKERKALNSANTIIYSCNIYFNINASSHVVLGTIIVSPMVL